MAKKKLSDLIENPEEETETSPAAGQQPKKKTWASMGVTLKQTEIAKLDAIGESLDSTRNSIMRFAIVKFLKEYESGLIELETEDRRSKRIKIPEE